MARDGASDVALVVISGGTADVAEQLREMCAASVERARPLAAGVAVLRAVGDASALLPQAGAALAIARRVGPGTVIS
jgi:hypothetical protein